MKTYYILLLSLVGIGFSAQVGINTTSPTRTLDINGNMRLRTTDKKSADNSYNRVIVTNDRGEIEYWDKANIQNELKGLEMETKIMYFSTSPSGNVIVPCGKFQIRFSTSTVPEIRLVTANTSDTAIYYSRARKLNSSDASFSTTSNFRTLRTNEIATIAIANNWVDIGTVSGVNAGTTGRLYAVNTLDEYYMSYPGDNYLYRITFLARKMTDTANSYTMLCEKF